MNCEMKKWFKIGTFGFFLLALLTLLTGCASNTMAVKASDAEISGRVVLIKEELEKIREQVQNIE